MTEPQQSPLFARYMKRLKWDVVTVGGSNLFLKQFPIMGTMAKLHRSKKLPALTQFKKILNTYKIKRLTVEPDVTVSQAQLTQWCNKISSLVWLNTSPFLPTKTIRIDLAPTSETIFHSFTEAKRRAVRRAIKLGVTIRESNDIDAFIRVKNASAGLFGFITTTGIRQLWETFSPAHANILLAYKGEVIVGCVLLLFWDTVAYYWIAGATKQGKKLFAPTLLVWEALKVSKKRGARQFDFVGVWDERMPKENRQWQGFTKFKVGFGGTFRYYPYASQNM